ncbi:MAG: FAD-dependent oxidoreductase [Rhodobacteraceae bacterium]|nr:FAD-dependent oxidoreductase [Paracoccaceae bacterium]
MTVPELQTTDIAVIGAGPAGMAAAVYAASKGADVVLLDDQPAPGGQVFRNLARASDTQLEIMGESYSAGRELLGELGKSTVTHIAGASVWEVTQEHVISFSVSGVARQITAHRVIIATGALERAMPFTGWTLPGVMTAGGAQIMLKSAGLIPPGPLVMAGSGPLVFLVALQLLRAGTPPAAIIDTTPARNRSAALAHLPRRLKDYRRLAHGLGWLRSLQKAAIPHYRFASGLKAEGTDTLSGISFTHKGRKAHIPCTTLLTHIGVVPNIQITRALGLEHEWDPGQMIWQPRLDDMGRTSGNGILVAGDCAGISGAEAAIPAGRLAAMAALEGIETAAPVPDAALRSEQAILSRLRASRRFLDQLYAPASEFLVPADDTIICRCEEVTAGTVRTLVAKGCTDPNQVKSLGRIGMGQCQGRYCGLLAAQVIADARGVSAKDVGYFRLRPPLKPLSMAELASLEITPEQRDDQ